LVLPDSTLWVSISIFYAKLYSNSFMASLNGRQSLRNAFNGRDFIDMPVLSQASTLKPSQHALGAVKLSPGPNTGDLVANDVLFEILKAGPIDGAQQC